MFLLIIRWFKTCTLIIKIQILLIYHNDIAWSIRCNNTRKEIQSKVSKNIFMRIIDLNCRLQSKNNTTPKKRKVSGNTQTKHTYNYNQTKIRHIFRHSAHFNNNNNETYIYVYFVFKTTRLFSTQSLSLSLIVILHMRIP